MYAPISISLLALASLLAITSAAPVPAAQTQTPWFDWTYPNIFGGSSSTTSTDTPSYPTFTGGSFPTGFNPPVFATFSVPPFINPGGFPTLPTAVVPSGVVPTDIVSGVFPTALPTAFPTGVFPTGVFPTGVFPTGVFPTATAAFPPSLLPTEAPAP